MALLASWHRERDVISECFVIGTPNVGPGTYDPRLPPAKTCSLGIGDRPSLSRDSPDLPGPGQYAVRRLATDAIPDRPSQSLTASCSSFNSTTSRCDPENSREPTFVPGSGWFVASTILDNPGPGQSDLRDPMERRPKTGGVYERSRPGKLDWGAERAVQDVKEGVRLHTQTEPAIKPLRDRSDWNFTGEPGDTPDPYSTQSLEIGRGKRKVHFGAPSERKSTWGNPHLKRNPGPGTYEHEPVKVDCPQRLPGGTGGGGPPVEKPGFGSDVPHCSTAFASSKVPTAFFPKSFSPALFPGPATYFADPPNPKTGVERALPVFRSVSARFADTDNGTHPGPGHYPSSSDFPEDRIRRARSVPDFMNRKFFGVQNPSQLKSLRETDGAALAGFGSRSPQRPITVSKSSAAPGSYDPESSLGQSISAKLRHLAKIAQGGAFGGSKNGERFFHGPGTGDSAAPVPASSLPHADTMKDAGDAARGSFKSEAPRLVSQSTEAGSSETCLDPMGSRYIQELPGPGSYDPITNPDFRAGWRIAKTEHVGFGVSGARFASEAADVPPPGSYEVLPEIVKGGCYSFRSTEARGLPMPKVPLKGLDPGSYDVAKSLVRKTFNTKVEENALLLQTPSDKRPPPRGPFPWAEGGALSFNTFQSRITSNDKSVQALQLRGCGSPVIAVHSPSPPFWCSMYNPRAFVKSFCYIKVVRSKRAFPTAKALCMQPLLGVLGSVCEVERQAQAAPEYEKWIAEALADADSVDGPFWLPCVRDQRDPLKSCSASANLSWIMQHFLSQLCQDSQQNNKENATPPNQPRDTGAPFSSGPLRAAKEDSPRDVVEPSALPGSPLKRPRTRPGPQDFASPLVERIAKAPSPIRALQLGPRPGTPCPVDEEAGGQSLPVPASETPATERAASSSPAKPPPRALPSLPPTPAERPVATVVAAQRAGPAAPAALAQDSTIEPTEEIHLPSRPAISMAEWKSKALFAVPPESPKEAKARSRLRPPASGQQALRKERQPGETQVEKTSPDRKDQSTPIKVADRIMMFEMLKTWTPQTEKSISPAVQCSKAGTASSAPRMLKPPSSLTRGSASTDRGSASSVAVDGSSLFTPVQHAWARDVKPKELFRHSDLAPTRPPLAKGARKPGPTTAFGSTVPSIPAKHVVATAAHPASARSTEGEPPESARSTEAFERLALGQKREDIAKPKSLRAAEQAKQAEERRLKERQEREQERERARIAAAQAAAAQAAQEARAKAAAAAQGPGPKGGVAQKSPRLSNEQLQHLHSPGFARHASAPALPLQERPVQVETVEDHQLKRMPSVPLFREPYLELRNITLSPKKPEDNYAISDYGGDSEGEDAAARERMRQKKAVPRWCDKYLLQIQKQVDVDPDTIFGKVPRCVLDDMFPDSVYRQARQKRPARRRGSSCDWRRDRLTRSEIRAYKQQMGQKRSWDDGHLVDHRR
ncbi:Ankk1 [Symbiodinium natans]|uniref:Ankk1 protein n=1 Tax=Symbiodinium natans TaxID=878477 RepID=A0A812H2T1_9DINO|nr:Ankk1 [Symbiodinium natans]